MGIENYEEKVKNRMPEKHKPDENAKESKESKEREREILEAARVCADYHDKLDPVGYFNGRAAKVAANLLPDFLRIKKDRLPESLQNVFSHRIAYLTMMTDLNKNPKILLLLDKLSPHFGNLGIFNKDFNEVLAECEKYPEFKKLNPDDLKKAYSIVVSGVKHLQSLTKIKGNWEDDAKKHLQNRKLKFFDKRVDDQNAAKNLYSGLQIAAQNLRKLEIKSSSKAA